MTTTTYTETAQRIEQYFRGLGATTACDDDQLQIDFPGDLTTVQDRMRKTLELVRGKPQAIKDVFYQDLASIMDMHDHYSHGEEVSWQNAERIYGMPVLVSFHRRAHRPLARPHENVPTIACSADLILPGIGPVMQGYETAPNGIQMGHITISLTGIEEFVKGA
jgi:hypothetical protein